MTKATTRRLEIESITIATVAALAGIFFIFYNKNHKLPSRILSQIPIVSDSITPTPTLPKSGIFYQISSDGTKKVVMEVTYNKDNTQIYSFSTADSAGNNGKIFFTKTLDESEKMTIPFNAWSPDNNYMFIEQQTAAGRTTDVLVFKASGEVFADGKKYLDATDIFKAANTGNGFGEVTGWASETLIIINSISPNGTKGPSYWLEVPTRTVIQLSTEF